MVLLDLKALDKWSQGSLPALFQAAHLFQAAVTGHAAAAVTADQLEDPGVFKAIVFEALGAGLSATEIGTLVGATKSTVGRWSTGDALPRYASARAVLARKILTRLQERRAQDIQEVVADTNLRIVGDRVVGKSVPAELALA